MGTFSATGNITAPSGNITAPSGNITLANVTQAPAANNLTEQVCADGSLPDVNGLCPDGNPPPSGNATQL